MTAEKTDVEDTTKTEVEVETDTSNEAETEKPEFKAIESQDELDKLITKRLSREKAKFADYDTLKELADKYRAHEDSQKDAATRHAEEVTRLKEELEKRDYRDLVKDVAAEKGLSPKLAKRLTGKTREELEADADDLLEAFPQQAKPPASDKPKPADKDSRKSKEPEDTFDPKAIAALIPR